MSSFLFPEGFVWGAATSAYQIEGAWNEGGRGASIWDTFSHQPGRVANNDNGDRACDSYHRLNEDLELLGNLGVNSYRFSLAWPRIFPDGTGAPNTEGVAYYHRLVDGLLERHIEPCCTLYHWDLPQALQDKGGWERRETAGDFEAFVRFVFREFGSTIKFWITINEPWCASFLSHYIGLHAPGKKDLRAGVDAAHNLLLAHAKAVRAFRDSGTKGTIGLAPNITYATPYSNSTEDRLAALRPAKWSLDWFLDPVFFGHYPEDLVKWLGASGVKPVEMRGDMELIHQPVDFLAANYYTSTVKRYNPEAGLMQSEEVYLGAERSDNGWEYNPEKLCDALVDLTKRYGKLPFYLTENGVCKNIGPDEQGVIHDARRIAYYEQHLASIHRALACGVDVRGYYAWSLLDNFEWADGYTNRFGLVWVDFSTGRRVPKDSFHWFARVARTNQLSLGKTT